MYNISFHCFGSCTHFNVNLREGQRQKLTWAVLQAAAAQNCVTLREITHVYGD